MRLYFLSVATVMISIGMAFAQDTNFPNGPQYLMNGSPMFARSISTPSMSFAGPPLEVGADNATGVMIPGADNQTVLPPSAVALPEVDLFPIYYGTNPVSVVEVSFAEDFSRTELPASILDNGVEQVTTVEVLRERGYGVNLAEAAQFGRAHSRHATRVFTNADIDRLHDRN
jgi:hypothetical protein